VRADVFQQSPHGDDVAHIRQVVKGDIFGGEKRGRHARQGRIFRAADGHPALDSIAAANPKFVHRDERLEQKFDVG
jgi:hypothetical protein